MRKMIQRAKNQKGFTLVELMVVVVILGILVAIAVPIFNNVTLNAAKRAHESNLRIIDGAIMQYYAAEDKYPTTIDELAAYVDDVSNLAIPPRLIEDGYYESGTTYGITASTSTTPAKASPTTTDIVAGTW